MTNDQDHNDGTGQPVRDRNLTKGDEMNEPEKNVARTQGACSLHEDGRRLAELQRRVAEAREVVTCACNYATRSEQIAEAAKHYGDALREYRAALESPTK